MKKEKLISWIMVVGINFKLIINYKFYFYETEAYRAVCLFVSTNIKKKKY